MPTEALQPMASLNIFQFQGECFHAYFLRFRELMDQHATMGFWYNEQQLCMSLIDGMNPETIDLAQYMSNRRLYCMDFSECWDFLCFMHDQCFQVDSISDFSMPLQVSYPSFESMSMDMPCSDDIPPCTLCSYDLHATNSCSFYMLEPENLKLTN